MDPNTIAQMDKVSGLSSSDITKMDQISGLTGGQPQSNPSEGAFTRSFGNTTPADALSGIPGTGALSSSLKPLLNQIPGLNTPVNNMPGGSIAKAILNPTFKAGETVAEGVGTPLMDLAQYGKITPNNRFISQDEAKQLQGNIGQATVEGLRTGAGAAAPFLSGLSPFGNTDLVSTLGNLVTTGGIRGAMYGSDIGPKFNAGTTALSAGVGAVLEPLLHILTSGLTTQKGVNRAMEEAKNESVDQGNTKSWDDIRQEAEDKLQNGPNKYRPDFVKAVEKVLNSRTPADTTLNVPYGPSEAAPEGGTTQALAPANLDANDLHDLRQALDQAIPQNAWNNPNVNPTAVDANKFVRQIVSDSLHEVAPQTANLDALNHLYYNPLIKGFSHVPILGNMQYPAALTGLPSAAINAALAAILEKTVGRRFGL